MDYANVYCKDADPQVPSDWDFTPGPREQSWRFDLKAKKDDDVGESFPVYVPKTKNSGQFFLKLAENERKDIPTRVLVEGKLLTFDAPLNFVTLTGIYMEVDSLDKVVIDEDGDL